jgi:nitrate reductase gamma subunit
MLTPLPERPSHPAANNTEAAATDATATNFVTNLQLLLLLLIVPILFLAVVTAIVIVYRNCKNLEIQSIKCLFPRQDRRRARQFIFVEHFAARAFFMRYWVFSEKNG